MNIDLSKLLKQETTSVKAAVSIKKFDNDQQIVYGEVYAPYVLDSHGEMMLPEDVVLLAHRFLIDQKNHMIDIMHNNKIIKASVIESFIARKGDPDYTEGAWVLATKIFSEVAWADVKVGKLNGYSLEAMVYKYDAEVVYDMLPIHLGATEENDGHFHTFWLEVDDNGRVTGGTTSEADDGHTHKIACGTATELSNGHAHRFFLNEIPDED